MDHSINNDGVFFMEEGENKYEKSSIISPKESILNGIHNQSMGNVSVGSHTYNTFHRISNLTSKMDNNSRI